MSAETFGLARCVLVHEQRADRADTVPPPSLPKGMISVLAGTGQLHICFSI
jgi:hypothetical protein